MGYTTEQKRIQRRAVQLGERRGESSRKIKAALMMLGAEANWTNPPGGDADSEGPRQARRSSYPNSPRRSVDWSINSFYDEARDFSDKTPARLIAQGVQRSAFSNGSNYQRYRKEAEGLYRTYSRGKGKRGIASRVRSHGMAKKRKGKVKGSRTASKAVTVGGTSSSRYVQQAQAQAELKYGAEERGLATLLRDTEAAYRNNVALEEGAAAGAKASAREAEPKVKKIYSDSNVAQFQTDSLIANALKKIGPAADAYKAVYYGEAGGQRKRRTEAESAALAELVRRGLQADTQRAYGLRRAQETYQSDRERVGSRVAEIAREKGTFLAATVGTQVEKQRDRNLKTKITNINARQRALDRKQRDLANRRTTSTSANNAALTAEQRALDREQRSIDKAKGRQTAKKSGGSGGSSSRGGETPGGRRAASKVISDVRSTAARIRELRTTKVNGKSLNSKQIRQYLKSKGVRNDYINAGYDVVLLGGLGPINYKRIAQLSGGSRWAKQLGKAKKRKVGKRTKSRTSKGVTVSVGY